MSKVFPKKSIPNNMLSPLNFSLVVFLISMSLMIMTAIFFLPQIKEERRAAKIKGFSVDLHHPFKAIHSDVVWFKNFIHSK